jgi:hypothetical protein
MARQICQTFVRIDRSILTGETRQINALVIDRKAGMGIRPKITNDFAQLIAAHSSLTSTGRMLLSAKSAIPNARFGGFAAPLAERLCLSDFLVIR